MSVRKQNQTLDPRSTPSRALGSRTASVRLLAIATLGVFATVLTTASARAVSLAPEPQDALQIKKVSDTSAGSSAIEFGLVFKNAKQPIGIDIRLGSDGGAPRLPEDAR